MGVIKKEVIRTVFETEDGSLFDRLQDAEIRSAKINFEALERVDLPYEIYDLSEYILIKNDEERRVFIRYCELCVSPINGLYEATRITYDTPCLIKYNYADNGIDKFEVIGQSAIDNMRTIIDAFNSLKN